MSRRRRKSELPKPELNITSMMDLVLNLLTFFILTSNFAMAELPHLEIPNPGNSTAKANERPDKVVVSVLPDGDTGNAQMIKMGVYEVPISQMDRLTDLLLKEKSKSKDVTVDLRADKTLHYDQVAPVMARITAAGISHVNVVAGLKDQRPAQQVLFMSAANIPHTTDSGASPTDPLSGAPRRRRRKHRPSLKVAALNITSFMDLTFNLLLFFILTASFSIGEGVMPADLPVGSGGGGAAVTTGPPKNPLYINLRSFGTMDKVVIQIEGLATSPANFDELYDTLKSWRHDSALNPNGIYEADNPIVIKPDRGVLWNHVVSAFNAVVRARYTNVGFQAVPPS